MGDQQNRIRNSLLIALAILAINVATTQVLAETLIIQGSTTFVRRLFDTHKGTIEADSKHELTLIPNKSLPGLIALMEGRAHMAMISASLKGEIEALHKSMPGLAYDRLQAHEDSEHPNRLRSPSIKSSSQSVAESDQTGSPGRNYELGDFGWSRPTNPSGPGWRWRRRHNGDRKRSAQRSTRPGRACHLRKNAGATYSSDRAGTRRHRICAACLDEAKRTPRTHYRAAPRADIKFCDARRSYATNGRRHPSGSKSCRKSHVAPMLIKNFAEKFALGKLGGSIAAKIYCFALLALLAVAALATASIYFSKTTESAAKILYGDGFIGITNSARLELLLEQHRRIVESLPAEVDRQRIQADRSELEQIKAKLSELMATIASKKGVAASDGLEEKIVANLPVLFREAEQVAFFAREFAQDKAAEHVAQYTSAADNVKVWVGNYRTLRTQEAQQAIALVSKTADSLMVWVLLFVVIACVLIGPVGLATMHNVLSRLGRITQAMAKLASNDTTTLIPSRADRDEVGDMARAVEVFKANAIQLISREIELKQLNRRIDVALNNMTHGLCMFDVEQKLIVCNTIYAQMYSLPRDLTQPGTSVKAIENYRAVMGNNALASPEQTAAATAQTAREASAFAQELMDGRVISVSQRPMPDGGWVAVHEDITERRRYEAKIAHLARHDMLTNLPNRVLFREHLEEAFREVKLGRGCAVHCLDLDNFKTVNDTLGHPVGDDLLKAVAGRLAEAVPSSDIVARLGGDEFAVIQRAVERPEQCSQLASRIVELVSKPYDIDGKNLVIGTSIGIALAPNDASDPDQLLKNADMALYLAKSEGRGIHRFFEREMDRRLQARRSLELDMREAILKGEFELYYQPIVVLETGKVSGFEALVRWNHPEHGQISPAQFIPLAEETGLIMPLGEWILRTACSQASRWPGVMRVAVNLSAAQFKGRNLAELAMNALSASGLEPQRLDLEITETVLLQDEVNTLAILHQLRSIGIRIALDDFGTGYSSLAYLRKFPFDTIKIDRSFVQDMLVRKDCQAIVRAVIGLARSLNITTIIEGVETKEQLAAAKRKGCDEGQGYLFAKPMPYREVADFLAKRSAVPSAA